MKRFIAATALLLAFSTPSYAAAVAIIAGSDTGGAQGHGFSSGALTAVLTTTASLSIGDLNVVGCAAGGSLTWSSASDSAGNTYTAALASTNNGTHTVRIFYSKLTNALNSGGTVTCTANSTSGAKTAVAVSFSGTAASPLDAASVTGTGTATTYSVGPTGTLAYPGGANGEVLVGVVQVGTSPPTNDAAFIDIGSFTNGGGAQASAAFGYKIVSASTAITYSPTGTSNAYAGNLAAFIGSGGGVANTAHGLSAIGAGK